MQNIQINPLKYPNIKCDKCGNETFVQAAILKLIPGIAVGTGTKDQIIDLPVYICSKCGEILYRDKESYGLLENNNQDEQKEDIEQEQKSSLLTEDVKSEQVITKLILD